MEIETAVEVFAIINLGTMGISHILAHRTWARFFIWLRSREEPGVFVVAFLSLGMGSIIVAFHPVWTGIPLVLTLFGWSQVLKAVIYLSFPKVGLKKLGAVSQDRSKIFILPGVFMLVIAGLLGYNILML
ncbi:hypothetical protein IH922_01190 [candidate division KSB1 bacterium]|nr:hypothetical protein [candidate division KSB1 bacterium]